LEHGSVDGRGITFRFELDDRISWPYGSSDQAAFRQVGIHHTGIVEGLSGSGHVELGLVKKTGQSLPHLNRQFTGPGDSPVVLLR
jgi:hypothetical protein